MFGERQGFPDLGAQIVGEPSLDTPDRAALADNPLAISGFRG
jgi:hypothetical protein